MQNLIPVRQLVQRDSCEVPVALRDLVKSAIPVAYILIDEDCQGWRLRQVVVQVAPLELASEVILKDSPREDDSCDTDRSAEVREPIPLLRAGLVSVNVYDIAVFPIADMDARLSSPQPPKAR